MRGTLGTLAQHGTLGEFLIHTKHHAGYAWDACATERARDLAVIRQIPLTVGKYGRRYV